MSKNKWDEILEDFRGRGKIRALKLEKLENGKWRLHYREGKKRTEWIDWNNRQELDEALIEFGGRNPSTIAAPDKFLKLDGTWDSGDLEELGHVAQKIRLHGQRTLRKDRFPIVLPDGCGRPEIVHSKKEEAIKFNKRLDDRERAELTVCFDTKEEFDKFVKEITDHKHLVEMDWYVRALNTLSEEDKKFCSWRRKKAGDGTKRMVLELNRLDGKHYNECIFWDLVSAADGMAEAECKKIPKPKKPSEELICYFAAKGGKFDQSEPSKPE